MANTTDNSSGPIGVISKSLAWVFHPSYSDTDPTDWLAFVILAVLLGMLWGKVIRQMVDNV